MLTQARNGARGVVSGSLDLFSNAFFASSGETSLGQRCALCTCTFTHQPERPALGCTVRSSAQRSPAGPLSNAVRHGRLPGNHQSLVCAVTCTRQHATAHSFSDGK
jgi:hypothetical protein